MNQNIFEYKTVYISNKAMLFLLMGATVALNCAAVFNLLAYFADSAYYFYQSISRQSYFLEEPSALTVQIIQQTPLVLAQYLGARNIYLLSIIFGMTLLMLPLALLLLTYCIIPKNQKIYFWFPLLHFLLGSQASFFPVVTEAPLAAGYFWVLFYFIIFYQDNKIKLPLLIFFSIPVVYLHESMAFLSPVLALVAVWRFRTGKNYFYLLTGFWYLVIAVIQLNFIINPRSIGNRSSFIEQLLHLKWIYWAGDGVNTSTIMGILFLVFFIANTIYLLKKRCINNNVVNYTIVLLFGVVVSAIVIYSFVDLHFYGVYSQFAARSNPGLISFPLALLALFFINKPKNNFILASKTNIYLLYLLWGGILCSHAAGVYQWSTYINNFKTTLSNQCGVVSYQELSMLLSSEEYQNFEKMSWAWTLPTMSLLLSENRVVKCIIKNKNEKNWQPFDPGKTKDLSQIKFFDIKLIIDELATK